MSLKKPRATTDDDYTEGDCDVAYDEDGSLVGVVYMEGKCGIQTPEGQDLGRELGLLMTLLDGFDEFETYSWSLPNTQRLQQGEWYVNFLVTPDQNGWAALNFLTWAVSVAQEERGFDVCVTPWIYSRYKDGSFCSSSLAFELCGRDCSPAHLSVVVIEEYDKLLLQSCLDH